MEQSFVFWRMWRVQVQTYLFALMTPWFYIQISSGATDYGWMRAWYGIRVNWNHPKGWMCREGDPIFTNGDNFLSFLTPNKQLRRTF
jgi:hypothetical protein